MRSIVARRRQREAAKDNPAIRFAAGPEGFEAIERVVRRDSRRGGKQGRGQQ